MELRRRTAIDTLVDGFINDPFFAALCADPQHRVAFLRSVFTFVIERCAERHIDVVGPVTAIWVPSEGPHIFSVEDIDSFRSLLVEHVTPSMRARVVAALVAIDTQLPTEPHDYLFYIAVGSDARGRGHGTTYLRHRLAGERERGRSSYLEATSPRNVEWFGALGFHPLWQRSLGIGDAVVTGMQATRPQVQ